MKKIRPLARYDDDQTYPSMAELESEGQPERRSFLKGLLVGAAAVGAGLWLGSEAQAQPKPRPNPLPPGVPPRPDRRKRPRPKDTPPVPGGGPQPNPQPTKQPCTTPATAVKLEALFAFCGGRNGEIHVTTADPQVANILKKPAEIRRFASVVKPVFAQEKNCGWLDNAPQKAQMEARLAMALTAAYQQVIGGTLQPLKVRLTVHQQSVRLPGVMPMPRPQPTPKRGCASCSTDASLESVLIPVGLVALALVARKDRSGD